MARFKTMASHPASSSTAVTLVLALASALGYRPDLDPRRVAALSGPLALATFAMAWLCAALGLAASVVPR